MSALPGMHYCKEHQGNHSHYDCHNCDVCKLTARIEAANTVIKKCKDAFGNYDIGNLDYSTPAGEALTAIHEYKEGK